MFDYLLKKSPFHIPIFLIHSELNTYIKFRGVARGRSAQCPPLAQWAARRQNVFSQGLIFSAASHTKKWNSISCDSALGTLLSAYLLSTKRA